MSDRNPNFYALLIGIDFYFPHRLPEGNYYANLRGCVQDINHVETYLKNAFDLPPDRIIKLTATATDDPTRPQEPPERLPTYENIVAQFKELGAKAKPRDRIYIHYSGHGGQATTIFDNLKGSGGLDEALVPTDIGQPNSRYLRDIEFAKLLEELVEKELVVTLVLDSCHSGGTTRNVGTEMTGDDRIRGGGFIDKTPRPTDSLVAPPEALAQNWQTLTTNSRNITVANGLLPEPKGYTLIAACRDNEFAYEDVFEGSERNGALTYFLLKTLREFGTDIAAEALFDRISNCVNNRFDRQTPMLIGEAGRTFFGSQPASANRSAPAIVKSAPVKKIDPKKNRVQLKIGEAIGIKKGAEFEIFKFKTRNFKDSQNKIATVKVVELGASDCWAEVTALHGFRTINNQLEEGMIEIGSPAVYVSPGLKQIRKVRLLLPDPLPQIPGINAALLPTILQAQKERIEGNRWIEFASEDEKDENIDYFVSLTSAGEYLILNSQKQPTKNPLSPIKLDEPEANQTLINRLIHLARYETILDLDNEDAFASLNGKLRVELLKSVKRQIVTLDTTDNVPELEAGERALMRIHNESNRTLNISALVLQSDFSIVQFYPKGSSYEVVEPSQYKDVLLDIQLPDNYREGVDVIKVFATVDGTKFQLLELPALGQSRKGFGTQKPANALEQLLATVADENSPQRNISVVAHASDEWTTEKIEVLVKNT